MWKAIIAVLVATALGLVALVAANLPLLWRYWKSGPNQDSSDDEVFEQRMAKTKKLLDDITEEIDGKLKTLEQKLDVQQTTKEQQPQRRELYGVDLAEGFTLPLHCPWLGYGYVCSAEPKYVAWLKKWAAKKSSWLHHAKAPLHPELEPLPRGNSLWLGTSHTYQTASALICQHHWELQAIEVMRCDKVAGDVKLRDVGECPKKVDAYKNELCESCIDDLKANCKMVAIEAQTRCENRAYPNVWGNGGTRSDSHTAKNMFPMPNSTREDVLCGSDRTSFPSCSFVIARFTFSNGHIATVIHNHVLQFYANSLQRFVEFLNMDMSAVTTIVYAAPWEQAVAKLAWKGDKYTMLPEDPDFFANKFQADIIDYAHKIGGFKGNIVLVSWHTDNYRSKDVLVAGLLLKKAQEASLDLGMVFSKDVVAAYLGNEWCAAPGENCGTNYSLAQWHQCTPGVPDVVAWDVQRLLRKR